MPYRQSVEIGDSLLNYFARLEISILSPNSGTLVDGTVYHSSYERGKPVTIQVNRLIKGWSEALTLMQEGAEWKLFIPPELAYGEKGSGQVIGPNEALILDVVLIKVH